MKYRTFEKICLGMIIVFVTAVPPIAGFRLYRSIIERAELAREFASENIQTTATGAFNQTLHLQLIDANQVRCNLTVGEILADAHLRGELVGDGFIVLSCGTLKAGIVR